MQCNKKNDTSESTRRAGVFLVNPVIHCHRSGAESDRHQGPRRSIPSSSFRLLHREITQISFNQQDRIITQLTPCSPAMRTLSTRFPCTMEETPTPTPPPPQCIGNGVEDPMYHAQ